jgi:hypothetical protein
MPKNDRVDYINPETINFVVKALIQHEKQMDDINSKLVAKRDELSTRTEKLSISMDEITKKLDVLKNNIAKLKIALSDC